MKTLKAAPIVRTWPGSLDNKVRETSGGIERRGKFRRHSINLIRPYLRRTVSDLSKRAIVEKARVIICLCEVSDPIVAERLPQNAVSCFTLWSGREPKCAL